ncbi:hypothetical protein ABKN59_004584 [Abortiporus biennis]
MRIFRKLIRIDGFFEGLECFAVGCVGGRDPSKHLLDIANWMIESSTMRLVTFALHDLSQKAVESIQECLKASFSKKLASDSTAREAETMKIGEQDELWTETDIRLLVRRLSSKEDAVGWGRYQQLKSWCWSTFGKTLSAEWMSLPIQPSQPLFKHSRGQIIAPFFRFRIQDTFHYQNDTDGGMLTVFDCRCNLSFSGESCRRPYTVSDI